jgi:hypothetical protein
VIGAWPGDLARLEAHGIRFTSPGFGRPGCAHGTIRIEPGRAPARVRLGYGETGTWAIDKILEGPGIVIEADLPAGDLDLLVCPGDVPDCVPGGRTLAARKLTLTPGGKFRTSIQWP